MNDAISTAPETRGMGEATERQRFSRLLIIEDDAAQLHTLMRIMQAEGFEVVGCRSAAEALTQLQRLEFGVAIVDLGLPDLDGVRFVERLRSLNSTIRMIIHTGYGSFESAKALLNLGVFAYVEKLGDPQELVGYVHRAVRDRIGEYSAWLEVAVAERTVELREREEWLRLAQSAAGFATWDLDIHTNTFRCSETYFALFGLEPSDHRVPVEEWLQRIYPDDRQRRDAEVRRALQGDAPFRTEYRIVWPDGSVRWVHSAGKVFWDEAGQPTRVIGASVDITERKQADEVLRRMHEELERQVEVRTTELRSANFLLTQEVVERRKAEAALQQSQALLRSIIDNTTAVIYVKQPDGRYLLINRQYEKLFNVTDEAMQGKTDYDLFPQHIADALRANDVRVLTTGTTIEFEEVVPHSDGLHTYISLKVPLCDATGTPYAICGLSTDITERKQAEQRLRQQEERLDLALRGADLGLWDWHIESGEVVFNERWAEMLGYRLDEILPHYDFLTQLVHPDDLPGVRTVFSAHLDGETPFYETEFRMRAKSGAWKWILARGKVVACDAHGKPLRVTGTHLDITGSKRLEQQFLQAQKLEAVGRLAGGIAHDFNNLLTAIIGYSELVLGRLRHDDRSHQQVTEIHQAGQRAATLTRQLLAFSRKQMLTPVVLDLNTVLTEMENLLHSLMGEDIELLLRLDPALRRVQVDPGQIEQVIMNLAVNARDAMPDGGTLSITMANIDLDAVDAQAHPEMSPGPCAMLAVTDTGCGMDAPTQARLFEPFFTTKEPGKGTGLGLATVFGIVKQSGGHIEVFSEVGHGTTFTIYLPYTKATQPQPSTRPTAPPMPRPGTETILLVEDAVQIRSLAHAVLQDAGYTVLEAPNGPEALRLSTQYQGPIHLLVTDVIMPGMSGRQLRDQLIACYPTMKVLFMSGYTDDALARHGVLEPGIALLPKPFAPDVLAHKVRAIPDTL